MAVAFYIFAVLAIAGALLMVTRKNPLASAFSLIVSIAALAGLFAMLLAEFIFVLQILVYAGAIMVLVIFTIMLLNLSKEELQEAPVGRMQGVVLILICAVAAYGFIMVLSQIPASDIPVTAGFGEVEGVGKLLLGKYLYQFEVISVLLLAAIVGVVMLAKKVI